MNYSIIPDKSNLEQLMQLTKKYGVNLEYNDFYEPSVYENDEEIENRIAIYKSTERNMAKDTMHGAFLGLDIAASDSEIRKRSEYLYDKSLNIANRLGVGGIVFHTGLIGGLRLESYLENWLDKSVSFWTQKCNEYPNITIYMENSFEREPDIFLRLMEKMWDIPNFKLCLDYGHAVLTDTPIDIWVSKLAPFIGHMHLNDNDLRDDLHLVPGQGKIDFDRWNELMLEYDINVPTLLEIKGYDNIVAALEYMRSKYE